MLKKKTTKGNCIFGAFFFSLAACWCVFGLWFFTSALLASYSAADWPVAQGVVTSSDALKGCGKGGRSYFPRVRYRYSVGMTGYTASRIAFGSDACGSLMSTREIANRYPPNNAVAVHYNPVQPSEAVLMVKGVMFDTYLGMTFTGLGLIVMLVAVSSHIAAYRRLSQTAT